MLYKLQDFDIVNKCQENSRKLIGHEELMMGQLNGIVLESDKKPLNTGIWEYDLNGEIDLRIFKRAHEVGDRFN